MGKIEQLESGALIYENDKGERIYYPPSWQQRLLRWIIRKLSKEEG